MSTAKPTSILAAMTAVQAKCPELANLSLGLEELYGKLRNCLVDNMLLATCNVTDCKPHDTTLYVGVKWHFSFGDGKCVKSRAAVVVPYTGTVSNKDLLTAQKISLLHVFFLEVPAGAVEKSANVNKTVDNLNDTLSKNGLPAVTTANQVESKGPTKKQLAEASQKLMDWKGVIDTLDPENPGEWDEHAQKLKNLPGLDTDMQIQLFGDMRDAARAKGVGYNGKQKRFYLLDS